MVGDPELAEGLENPQPAVPEPRGRGAKPTRLKAAGRSLEVRQWAAQQPAARWIAFQRREGINGALRGEFLHERVWLWDGREERARLWPFDSRSGHPHLIVWRPAESPQEIKYVLCNAPADTAPLELARMASSRYWVERAFQDAKSSVGMHEYQLRGWMGWHHHMSLVMLAMIFMLQQKVLLAEEVPLLSTEDIAWVLEKYLPNPHATEEEVQKALARRHRRRQIDIDSKKRRDPPRLEDVL